MPVRRNKKGIVYIAWNKAMPSLVKIGVTEGCAHHRVKTISNQSVPFDYVLVAQFETCDCLSLEQFCHEKLASMRVSKEFFKISKSSAKAEIIKILPEFGRRVDVVDYAPKNNAHKDMR